jgi:hypothetical protein
MVMRTGHLKSDPNKGIFVWMVMVIWFEAAGHDVGLDFAAKSYVSGVLPYRRDSGIETVE